MKENWKRGLFDVIRREEMRVCIRKECEKSFSVTPSDPKMYCGHACSTTVNNLKRGSLPDEVKQKIARSMTGKISPYRGVLKTPLEKIICANSSCKKIFFGHQWAHRKFCSNQCAMSIIGGKPTSPRAARAKAGVRPDLGNYYFYSRWEANYARILNLLNIKWEYQPKTFNLKFQTYTPDFYTPEQNLWIEIKNFLSEYSGKRDAAFRKLYPTLKLALILKPDYLKLQEQFASKIKNWEYS